MEKVVGGKRAAKEEFCATEQMIINNDHTLIIECVYKDNDVWN
ncbi:MAG: hypothetical protein ACQETL_17210 [Bacteroidota bacterium]